MRDRLRNGGIKPVRIIEAVIIAAIVGAISIYGTTIALEKDLDNLKENQSRMENWLLNISSKVSSNTIKAELMELRINSVCENVKDFKDDFKDLKKEIRKIEK